MSTFYQNLGSECPTSYFYWRNKFDLNNWYTFIDVELLPEQELFFSKPEEDKGF